MMGWQEGGTEGEGLEGRRRDGDEEQAWEEWRRWERAEREAMMSSTNH